MVELALRVIFRAAVVEAEFLVGEVKSGDEQLEAVVKRIAALGVDLGVVVVIVVTERARWSAWRPVPVLVVVDAGPVEVDVHLHRERPAVEGGTDVKEVGGVIQQAWLVAAPGNAAGLGTDVAVVGIHAEAAKESGQIGPVLEVLHFNAADPGAAGVDEVGGEVVP